MSKIFYRKLNFPGSSGQRGMTVVELTIAMLIMAGLAAVGTSSYLSYSRKAKADGAQWLIYNMLVRTRAQAVAEGRVLATDDLVVGGTGATEAGTLSGWLEEQLGVESVTVNPESVGFDGRGRAVINQEVLQLDISTPYESRIVSVSRNGHISLESPSS